MSTQAVVELSAELRRLAIAGTDLAVGDRRLAALVPALGKSGAKASVLARIAERAGALAGSDRAGAAARFLQLNALVRTVLAAGAGSGVAGEIRPPPAASMTGANLSARTVRELAERIRDGRAVDLDDPSERERFADPRLMAHAVDALDAGDPQVADTAAKRFVPLHGRAVVPLLTARLDPRAKRPAARIVEAVAAADADGGARLARQVLDPDAERAFDSLPDASGFGDEAKVAALGALGGGDADRALLRDALGARKKAMRIAASSRLVELGDDPAVARCVDMLGGPIAKAREAVDALRGGVAGLESPSVREALHASVRRLLDKSWRERLLTADVEMLHDASLLLCARTADDDASSLALARAMFEGFLTSREGGTNTGLRSLCNHRDLVGSIVARLIRHAPDDEVLALAERAMELDVRTALEEIAVRRGPDEAWRCLERASVPEPERLWGVRRTFEGVDPGAPSNLHARLPPPGRWGAEWMGEGLRYRDIGLVWYLHRHHPGRIFQWARGAGEAIDADFLMLLLKIDPGCAPWLAVRARRSVHHFREHFEPLCRAVEARDAEACATSLDAFARFAGGDDPRLVALRERLAERAA